jgi:hypothetical protein
LPKRHELSDCRGRAVRKSNRIAAHRELRNVARLPERRMSGRPKGPPESIPRARRNLIEEFGHLRRDRPLRAPKGSRNDRFVSRVWVFTGDFRMRLHTRMKAGLLLLAIAGTIVVTGGTAQARHWRHGCCGGCGYGYGGYGGCGCGSYAGGCGYSFGGGGCGYGGCGAGGCGVGGCGAGGCGTTAYYGAPAYGSYVNSAPIAQPMYGQGGCGPTTAAYPPAPMPGQPGGYNGTTYEANGTPTYAPGSAPPPPQAGNDSVQHSAAMNPANTMPNQPNAQAPPAPAATEPPAPAPTNSNPPNP